MIEEILGTTKDENETWADVFKRIDEARGVDLKTLTKVVVYILGELDVQKEREKTRDIFDSREPDYTVTAGTSTEYSTAGTSEGIAGGTGEPEPESAGIQSGDRPVEEEIQPGPADTSEPLYN